MAREGEGGSAARLRTALAVAALATLGGLIVASRPTGQPVSNLPEIKGPVVHDRLHRVWVGTGKQRLDTRRVAEHDHLVAGARGSFRKPERTDVGVDRVAVEQCDVEILAGPDELHVEGF